MHANATDTLRQIAASSDCSAQTRRAMHPPLSNAQPFNMFDTRSDINNKFKDAQDKLNSLNDESIRAHLSRIAPITETVRPTLHATNDDLPRSIARANNPEIPRTNIDLAMQQMLRAPGPPQQTNDKSTIIINTAKSD